MSRGVVRVKYTLCWGGRGVDAVLGPPGPALLSPHCVEKLRFFNAPRTAGCLSAARTRVSNK